MSGADLVTWLWASVTWLVALAASVLGGTWVTPWVLRTAARTSNDPSDPARTDPGSTAPPGPPPSGSSPSTAPGRGPGGAPGAGAARRPLPPVPPPPRGGPTGTAAVSALRGGTWIGVLERLAITLCLLAGFPAGIAFVVAIKGLGRYPELREHPVASERFVIGTLASMIWAVVWGLAGAAVLGALR